jgi:hypothetical protein
MLLLDKNSKNRISLGGRFESYNVRAKLNGATAFNDDYITVYPSASMTFLQTKKSISNEL